MRTLIQAPQRSFQWIALSLQTLIGRRWNRIVWERRLILAAPAGMGASFSREFFWVGGRGVRGVILLPIFGVGTRASNTFAIGGKAMFFYGYSIPFSGIRALGS